MTARFRFRRRKTVPGIARELLRCFEDESRWTRVMLARDDAGDRAEPTGANAVQWCAAGAAGAVCRDHEAYDRFEEAFIAAHGGVYSLWWANDNYGLPAVRRVLRKLARGKR